MKTTFTFLAITMVYSLGLSQAPGILGSQNYGGSGADMPYAMIETSDQNYIIVGSSASVTDDVGGNNGGTDYWILKIDPDGEIIWEENYGGSGNDVARSVIEMDNGDFVILGYSMSLDGDVTGNNGQNDFWLIRIDSQGSLIWEKSFGGSANDYGIFLAPTSDGGIITTGNTFSADGDISESNGGRDMWVTRHDSNGDLLWEQAYGGSGDDVGLQIVEDPDGNYFVTGNAGSSDGDVVGFHGENDAWALLLDDAGDIIWQRATGGSAPDFSTSFVLSDDGGYIIAGHAQSSDGDVESNQGGYDTWVFKLNSNGELEWQNTFGGSGDEFTGHIFDALGAGYILSGNSNSLDGDVIGNNGDRDAWLIRVDDGGADLLWAECFGGTGTERGLMTYQNSDGSFQVLAHSNSSDGDVLGNYGGFDFWLIQLGTDPLGLSETSNPQWNIYPNPATSHLFIQVPEGWERSTLRITDLTGKLVREFRLNSTIFEHNVGDLSKGVYVFSLNYQGTILSNSVFIDRD